MHKTWAKMMIFADDTWMHHLFNIKSGKKILQNNQPTNHINSFILCLRAHELSWKHSKTTVIHSEI